jgi:hypothetical protein
VTGDGPDLPPSFRMITLREAGDAFAHAQAIAAAEGAGTLVRVGRFDLAEFAVVLEPAEPLRTARFALYAGMLALGDALAGFAPPQKPIRFDWPDAVRLDGGLVGGARLAWPPLADEDAAPDWLVFGAMLRLEPPRRGEPGLRPLATTLRDEGYDGVSSIQLIERFARHLMAAFDLYASQGPGGLTARYLARLSPEDGDGARIDAEGDLLAPARAGRTVQRRSLRAALAQPAWFDPISRGPRR